MVEITENDKIDQCIHGTYHKCWDAIKQSGLSRMNRLHIHFSEDFPGSKNVISGMR
jgi:2'-phosphotransferase